MFDFATQILLALKKQLGHFKEFQLSAIYIELVIIYVWFFCELDTCLNYLEAKAYEALRIKLLYNEF